MPPVGANSRDRALDVVLVSNALGIGGTEKGLVHHALSFDPERVRVRVVGAFELGKRAERLRSAGIQVDCADGDPDRLAELLRGADVVHVFRAGSAEPLVPEATRRAGVPVLVETNVFGSVDASADEPDFACHLLVGKVCALRYRHEAGLEGPEFHDRHRVAHWPLLLDELRGLPPSREEAKRELGLDPSRPVVGRVGRDSDRNWRDMIVDMVGPLTDLVPDAQVMIVGITPQRRARLRRHGWEDRVTLIEPDFDERRVAAMFAACDVFVTAAELGESYSVAISEAMAMGLPVVTCSTPWHNNGQLEQVDEGVTGHVANHPQAFAEAVASLLTDADRRERFGAAAAAKADELFDAGTLTRRLEDLYEALVAGEPPPADWHPSPADIDAFPAEYERRQLAEFRPLTPRERSEALWARVRERSLWALRALRTLDREKVRGTAAMVRSRLPGR